MRLRSSSRSELLVLLCLCVVVSATSSCSFTDPASGLTYDLSPLAYDPSQLSPPGYNGKDQSGQTYYINFCQEVSYVDSRTSACNKNAPAGSCITSGGNYHSAGQVVTEQFSSEWNDDNAPAHTGNFTSGISLTYTNGDGCTGMGPTYFRATTIMVACNPDEENGGVYGAYDTSQCAYIVYFSSSLACGQPPVPPTATLIYQANNISMQEHDRVVLWTEGGWEQDYVAYLQVNSGVAALGVLAVLNPFRPVYWLCANSVSSTTSLASVDDELFIGCMQGPCDVNVKIGTPNVGRCFQYNSTALISVQETRYRGDNDRCHWDSLCTNPIGGPQ